MGRKETVPPSSLSYAIALRLRGRAGVGVFPQTTPAHVERTPTRRFAVAEAFASASLKRTAAESGLCLPRKRERWSESAARSIELEIIILYSAASTAFAISAVPLLPPNSIGLMPPA